VRDDPDRLDAAFAALMAALAAFTWAALLLAEVGAFSRLALLGTAVPAGVAAGWWTHRSARVGAGAAPARDVALLVSLLVASTVWLGRPAEPLLEGNDATAYLNAGRSLARHGGLVYREPLLDLVDAQDWDAVLDRELHPPRVLNLFPGSLQVVPGVPEVRPGFFHLNTVWIGAAELLAGGRAAYYVPWLSGLLTLAAFWMLARRVVSVVPATLGAALLASNVAFHWFSRLPMAEMPAAALVLAGLGFAVRLTRPAPAAPAILAGACFGLAAFARIDVLLFVIPVVVGYVAVLAVEHPGRREWRWMALALAATAAHAVLHAATIAGLYVDRVAYHMLRARSVSTASRVLPPVLVVIGLAAWLLSRRGGAGWLARTIGAMFVLGVVAAFVRIGPRWLDGALALLLTPAGTALALIGVVIWLARDRTAPTLLLVGVWIASMLVYAESARDFGLVPWTLRRYVPVVLPLSVLAIAVLADRAWRAGGLLRAGAVTMMVALTATFGVRGAAVTREDALGDLHRTMAAVADTLPPESVVVTDITTPSHFGVSLYGTFGRSVLFVSPSDATARVLRTLAERLEARGRPLVVAVAPDADDARGLAAADFVGLELGEPRLHTVHITTLEATVDRIPESAARTGRRMAIYRARVRPPVAVPRTFEMGENDVTLRGMGFHDVELMGSAYARWTNRVATLHLPQLAPLAGARLLLRLAGPRPASHEPPTVSVALDGHLLSAVGPMTPGFEVYEVSLPDWALDSMAARATVLSLRSPTFSPADSGSSDTRQLGVAVDWARVEPTGTRIDTASPSAGGRP
jgi:hypothetical protein